MKLDLFRTHFHTYIQVRQYVVKNTGIFKCFIPRVYVILKILNGIQHYKKKII